MLPGPVPPERRGDSVPGLSLPLVTEPLAFLAGGRIAWPPSSHGPSSHLCPVLLSSCEGTGTGLRPPPHPLTPAPA